MNELNTLTAQRDELLSKIREIEASCEGIENENNAKRVQELNLEQAKLSVQKNEISAQLTAVQGKLTAINNEIVTLSETGINRILEAIKNQRWYFFKNKLKVLMDRDTGLLWANLQYFPWCKNNGMRDPQYSLGEVKELVVNCNFDMYTGWSIPKFDDFKKMIEDKTFPFHTGSNYDINNALYWYCDMTGYDGDGIDLGDLTIERGVYFIIPDNNILVANSDYENNVSPNNPVYTEKERLQFTLDVFVQNELQPIFDDDEITQLYKKIYFEKPTLLNQLKELQNQIEALQTVTLLSSEFDYTALLAKYDITSINNSIIKYYQAIQQWTDELMEKLDYYEQEKEDVIRDFNIIGLKLSKKYESNTNLTKEENTLLEERQRFFQKKFSLGMNSVKSKILSIKRQANDLEYRIDEIDNSDNAIHALALLEQEQRASFSFIAENTAKIIKNALLKIEYFESHHSFVMSAIQIWETWSEDYRVFKTTYKEDLKNTCEEDGIEQDVWAVWYQDWQQLRFAIEQKVQPIIERGLKGDIITCNDSGDGNNNIIKRIIRTLDAYKNAIDKFYLEERKGIYQKYVFQSGGELQDKFETESSLYRFIAEFQSALQEIIFECKTAEDRIFILNWANSLLDIPIDEILEFVADNDLQKISKTILDEFALLKQKNYDIYLADAKAYSEEKARREKQYNSLIFKMRKDLMK